MEKMKTKHMQLYETLYRQYGPQHWWPADTPFEMAVGAILVQNTSWKNVEKVMGAIGHKLSPAWIAGIEENELAEAIRSSGFNKRKAKTLKGFSDWFMGYESDPETVMLLESDKIREELLSIPGIGYETADSIMLYGFGKLYFVVDAYTRRLFEKAGLPAPKSYEAFRKTIEEALPRDLEIYKEFHALIVENGKWKG